MTAWYVAGVLVGLGGVNLAAAAVAAVHRFRMANRERRRFTESVQDLATQHDPHDHRIEMLLVDRDGQ